MVFGALGDCVWTAWLLRGVLFATGVLLIRSPAARPCDAADCFHKGSSPSLLLLPAIVLSPADEVLAPSSAIEIGIRSDPDTAVSLETGRDTRGDMCPALLSGGSA